MATNEVRYKFTAEDSQFKKVAGNVGSEIKKMAKDGSLGVAALGTAFAFLGVQIKDTLDIMDRISKMSQKTGVSVEDLSALKYAAELSDVSLESLEKSFIKLSKAIDANSPAFKELGIELKDSEGKLKKNIDISLEVADAFMNMEDGATKTALATEIFGKAGADMIPLLNGGSEAIRAQMTEAERLKVTFDEISAKQAERFNDSITTITATAKGFTQELVLALMPAIDDMSGGLEGASGKADKLKDKLTPLQLIARGVATGFLLIWKAAELVGKAIALLIAPIVDIVKGLGGFFDIVGLIMQGDFDGAKTAANKFDMKPFWGTTTAAWSQLSASWDDAVKDIMNSAMGTQFYGGGKIPNGKQLTDKEWYEQRLKQGNLTKEQEENIRKELKKLNGKTGDEKPTGGTPKTDAKNNLNPYLTEVAKLKRDEELLYEKWVLDNQKATIKEKLKREEEYYRAVRKIYEDFIKSPEYQKLNPDEQLKTIQDANKLSASIDNLAENIAKNNNVTVQDDFAILQDQNRQALGALLGELNILKASLGMFTTSYMDANTKRVTDFAFDDPKNSFNKERLQAGLSSTNLLETIDKELQTTKNKNAAFRAIGFIFGNKQMIDEINAWDVQATKNAEATKTKIKEEEAKIREEITNREWKRDMGIISNALGAIGGLFQKHTAAYKAFAIAQATIDTWVGANTAFRELPFPLDWIQFSAVLAQGFSSVASIMNVGIPAYAKGGLVTQPTIGLMGEKGPEIIAPQRDFMDYSKQLMTQVANYNTEQSGYQNESRLIGALQNLKLKVVGKDLVLAYDKNKLSDTRLRMA